MFSQYLCSQCTMQMKVDEALVSQRGVVREALR